MRETTPEKPKAAEEFREVNGRIYTVVHLEQEDPAAVYERDFKTDDELPVVDPSARNRLAL